MYQIEFNQFEERRIRVLIAEKKTVEVIKQIQNIPFDAVQLALSIRYK